MAGVRLTARRRVVLLPLLPPNPDRKKRMMILKPRHTTHRKPLVGAALVAVLAAAGGSGCGDSPGQIGQATTYKQGKYQGKPDTPPYAGGPTAYSQEKTWQPDDRVAWEKAIKTRQQAQNEYNRAE